MALGGLFKGREEKGLERIAAALERLASLYELDLRCRGLTLETGTEEGEFSYTDDALIERLERDENVRRAAGLPASAYPHPTRPDGREWGPNDLLPAQPSTSEAGYSYGFTGFSDTHTWGSGPEGAEGAQPQVDPLWYLRVGPPPPVTGHGGEEIKERQSGADRPEEPQRDPEVPGSPASEETRA